MVTLLLGICLKQIIEKKEKRGGEFTTMFFYNDKNWRTKKFKCLANDE